LEQPDPKELGSIYHAMIAWECSNPGILDNRRGISDFLSRQASPLSFDAEALRVSLKVGRIDLLIRTADGLVVMDHKLAGNSDGKSEEIVATWASQLALYAKAIARVSGKPSVGTWLNLPLEGSAARVKGAV
jgi:ATP-dependent exoDNAse (exonuclease V) beta subunit